MKSTICTLTLASVCSLFGACGDEPQKPSKNPVPKLVPGEAHAPALTSAAPTPPRSVLRPTPYEDEPHAAAQHASAAPPEQISKTPTLEAEAEPPVDYDRPVSPSEVRIDRFLLATGVEAREPLGVSDTFSADTKKIFAFVQFANEHAEPYALRVHWEKLDGPATPYGFKLEVPTAKRWRTWSWTAIRREPGHYRAVLRTLDGQEVASREFVLE